VEVSVGIGVLGEERYSVDSRFLKGRGIEEEEEEEEEVSILAVPLVLFAQPFLDDFSQKQVFIFLFFIFFPYLFSSTPSDQYHKTIKEQK
jgi:hypothetical protein